MGTAEVAGEGQQERLVTGPRDLEEHPALLLEGHLPVVDAGLGRAQARLRTGDGQYTDGITVTIQNTGDAELSWTSDLDVDAVIVKGAGWTRGSR